MSFNNIIITILWYIENPGRVRIVYLGISRHIHANSAIFSHVRHTEQYSDIRYSGIIEMYGVIIRHIWNSL